MESTKIVTDSFNLDSATIVQYADGWELPAIFCKELVKKYGDSHIFMPFEEVKKAADTIKGVPTTLEHVNLDLPSDSEDVGQVLSFDQIRGFVIPDSVMVDEDKKTLKGIIWLEKTDANSQLIEEIKSGTRRDLSITYRCVEYDTVGEHEGVRYDAVQKDIEIFSVAHTKKGRCSFEAGCGIRNDSVCSCTLIPVREDSWSEGENFISAIAHDLSEFIPKTLRFQKIKDGIYAVVGKLKDNSDSIHAYRFKKSIWTTEKAKNWIKSSFKTGGDSEEFGGTKMVEIKDMCLDSLAKENTQVSKLIEQNKTLTDSVDELKKKLADSEQKIEEQTKKITEMEEAEKTRVEKQRTSLIEKVKALDPESEELAKDLDITRLEKFSSNLERIKGEKKGDSTDPKEPHTGGDSADKPKGVGFWNAEKGEWGWP